MRTSIEDEVQTRRRHLIYLILFSSPVILYREIVQTGLKLG